MKAKKRKEIEVAITMNEEEARWLKSIMQNPIYGVQPEEESNQSREMRHIFWNELDKEGVELI